MFVLSREIGESVAVEDVDVTLVRIGEAYVEVSMAKSTGRPLVITLPHDQAVDICYNVQMVFISKKGTKAYLGFEAPKEITITRRES